MTFEESEKQAKRYGGKLHNRYPHLWDGYESVTYEFPPRGKAREFARNTDSIYAHHICEEFRNFTWVTIYLPLIEEQQNDHI